MVGSEPLTLRFKVKDQVNQPAQGQNEDDDHSHFSGLGPMEVLSDEPADVVADVEELEHWKARNGG